jgi:hypothetical protein
MMEKVLSLFPWKKALQRLLGVWNILFVLLLFFGPESAPVFYALYVTFLHAVFALNNIRTLVGVGCARVGVSLTSKTDWTLRYCAHAKVCSVMDTRHDLPYNAIGHIIIIPNYKEDKLTLTDTLEVLASHENALTHYKVFTYI